MMFDGQVYAEAPWELSHGSQSMGLIAPALIHILRAKTVIEIGVADAFMTHVLAAALADSCPGEGVLISIDKNDFSREPAKRAGEGKALMRHEVIIEDSSITDWAACLATLGRKEIDFAVVDGEHKYDGQFHDMVEMSHLLRRDGMMLVHDVVWGHPDVVRAVDDLRGMGWERIWLPALFDKWIPAAIMQRTGRIWEPEEMKGQEMAKIVKLADLNKPPDPHVEAVVAKLVTPALPPEPEVALADCCVEATRRWEASYVRAGGAWSQIVIVRERSEGGKDFWRTVHVPGPRNCQYCGTALDGDTPTRRYHRGFAPLDTQIDAMVPPAQAQPQAAAKGGIIAPPKM